MSTEYSSIEEAWGVTNLEDPTAGIVPKKIPIPQSPSKPKPKRARAVAAKNVTAAAGSSSPAVADRSPIYTPRCSVSTIRAMVYDAYVNGGPYAVLDMLGPDVTKDIFWVYTNDASIGGQITRWIEDIPNDPNKIALVVAVVVLALLMFR